MRPVAKALGDSDGNHIDLRHRYADFLREPLDSGVGSRQLFARNWLRAIHGQSDFVRIKIRDEVHDDGDGQRQEHSVLAAEGASDEHQKQRESGQQERGLKGISHSYSALVLRLSLFMWLDVWTSRGMHSVLVQENVGSKCVLSLP